MTGFVFMRVRAHRLLLTAALLTVVLTTSVLATLAAFTGVIGDAGLRRTLEHQCAAKTTINAQMTVTAAAWRTVDTGVRKNLGGAYDGLPAQVRSSTRSGPYALPIALRGAASATRKNAEPDLTLLATFDRAHVTLIQGGWPGAVTQGSGALPVAVPEHVARSLGVRPGAIIDLTSRLGGPMLRIQVTGTYRPADRSDPYWQLDPMGGHGVRTVSFTTYGPLLADPSVFGSGRLAPAEMSWQSTADFRTLGVAGIPGVREDVQRSMTAVSRDPANSGVQISSDLPDLLTGVERTLLVTRSTLLIGALQLLILAGFALLLVAQLLSEERAGETALLRARGGSRGRVARLAANEALLLAVPAGLAAPLLAGPVIRLLAGHGALARSGTDLGGAIGASAWWVAAGTALACAFAVIVPALRGPGTYVAERSARARRGALPGAVQAGADLGLLLLAGIAYWQLSRRASGSGVLSSDTGGTLGVDPVLVAAPALCLLAGTVLVLRLLPLAARLGERRAARGSGLSLALAGWQLSRRPRRGAGAVLLLVLAVAMGIFAIGQGASWDRSQSDQADFTVGADLRVTGSTTPPFGQAGIYEHVPGVATAAPAARAQLSLPQQRVATILVIDTAKAGGVMRMRDDLSDRPLAELLRPLRAGEKGRAGDTGGFGIPAAAQQLRFTTQVDANRPSDVVDSLTATVRDGNDVAYVFSLGDVPADGKPHQLVLDLADAAGHTGGSPAGPLRLTRIEADYKTPEQVEKHRLNVSALEAVTADGTVRPVVAATGSSWVAKAQLQNVDAAYGSGTDTLPAPGPATSAPGTPLTVTYATGAMAPDPEKPSAGAAQLTVQLAVPDAPVLSGIATDAFLRAAGSEVGSEVRVELNGTEAAVHITGVVHALPGITADAASSPADGGGLLLDLRAVDRMLDGKNGRSMEPSEWWLSARPGATAQVAAALRDRADIDSLLVRDETARELRADPLGAGPQSALPAAVIAAAVLAAVGFAVSSAGAIRERSGEFAVLRALGAPRRKLARMLAAEQGLLVLLALVVGVALGALLTRMVVPLIVLTTQASQPVPKLLVTLPVAPLVQLIAMVLVVPLLVVVLTAVRRGDPVTALRSQGED
ncbi:FtsX-like permease family protein [Streptomyces sp. H10-C2]|uniref:FtsX-like permease family protein n=1 Tax=unclassified Streptomyces TaxID=2593676 RepID=UPI0024BBD219|nr:MULTISPECIES: FtsX-like permease family protein [unclassified Streptomyces]MDJ0340074.1 FtsX-like permease family protein [Streptomyces sp. PH10-H1]MDJ0369289.1 FtsX-like permease family protein [Streptomyces sp. H10-C2]